MNLNARWLLGAGLTLMTAFVAILALQRSGERGAIQLATPKQGPSVVVAEMSDRTTAGNSAPIAKGIAPPKSGRAVLEELWGQLTPEAEAAIRESGIDLEAECTYPPWETVSDAFQKELGALTAEKRKGLLEAQIAWPTEMTVLSMKARFPVISDWKVELTDQNVAEISSLVAEDNYEIENRAVECVDLLDLACQWEWQSGGYQKSPLTTWAIPSAGRHAFHATAMARDGWSAKLLLYSDQHPEIVEILSALQAARNLRDEKVKHYLLSLK